MLVHFVCILTATCSQNSLFLASPFLLGDSCQTLQSMSSFGSIRVITCFPDIVTVNDSPTCLASCKVMEPVHAQCLTTLSLSPSLSLCLCLSLCLSLYLSLSTALICLCVCISFSFSLPHSLSSLSVILSLSERVRACVVVCVCVYVW